MSVNTWGFIPNSARWRDKEARLICCNFSYLCHSCLCGKLVSYLPLALKYLCLLLRQFWVKLQWVIQLFHAWILSELLCKILCRVGDYSSKFCWICSTTSSTRAWIYDGSSLCSLFPFTMSEFFMFFSYGWIQTFDRYSNLFIVTFWFL